MEGKKVTRPPERNGLHLLFLTSGELRPHRKMLKVMKIQKPIITLTIILTSLISYSQLKVLSNGKLAVGEGTVNNDARLNISDTNNSTIYSKAYHSSGWGDAVKSEVNQSDGIAFAVYYNDTRNIMLFGDGEIRCVDVYETSDSTLKENINTLTSLEKVKQLRGVRYQLKKDEEHKEKIGLIAQEVEPIIPEVIQTSPEGEKAIAYSKLVAILIEAIKEQQQTIEKLQAHVETIENDCCNSGLETKNATMNPAGNNSETESAKLFQNQPNPFNRETLIRFEIPQEVVDAQLYICNMSGVLLKTIQVNQRGQGIEKLNSNELNAGMYLYSLVTDGKLIDTKQMLLTE
jgi:hypothetical protein